MKKLTFIILLSSLALFACNKEDQINTPSESGAVVLVPETQDDNAKAPEEQAPPVQPEENQPVVIAPVVANNAPAEAEPDAAKANDNDVPEGYVCPEVHLPPPPAPCAAPCYHGEGGNPECHPKKHPLVM